MKRKYFTYDDGLRNENSELKFFIILFKSFMQRIMDKMLDVEIFENLK